MRGTSIFFLFTTAALTACASAPAGHDPAGAQSSAPPASTGLGVSLELARERARTLADVRYDLMLDLTSDELAAGRVVIDVVRSADAGDLVVDFRGPVLDTVRANGMVVVDPRWQDGHFVVPAARLRAGQNRIEATFAAAIAPAGASIIRYDDEADDATYLYTLLVPADANQLFPSFDQPDLKARVTFHARVPDGWRVLANGAERERANDGGALRVDFAETQPISTYLIAFAAGPWSVIDDNANDARVPSSLWLRRARADEADSDTLLATNTWARRWLEDYFAMQFPFAKMDLLLAPAFPFGGMEHVGAIFYNENSFIFREPPTETRRLGRDATIYHEVAHQWFGDLVTMEWFDDLWLKEGFATYMAAKIQAERSPDSGAWKTFYLRNKPSAYGVDETSGTTPVWQQLANLDLAKGNYGAIVYNKAPSILKQLEFLVGADAFRTGVQNFLRAHAYANATWQDLLASIGAAASLDLSAFGDNFMLRAGMPRVETELVLGGGHVDRLVLTQSPARAMPEDPGGHWPMRVRVRLGYADRPDTTLAVTLDAARTVVTEAAGLPAPDYVFANDGDYGYGLFMLDDRSAAYLLDSAGTLDDDLLRAMVWGALWDRMRAARLEPLRFAEHALAALPAEQDEQIAGVLTGRIGAALGRYAVESPAADSLAAQFEALLLARANDAGLSYGMRRSALDAFLGFARTPSGTTALRDYLRGDRTFDGEPLRQPSRWDAVTRLLALDDAAADRLYRFEMRRDTTSDAARYAFIAGAAIATAENKRAYFERYLEDASLNEEWVTASMGAFNDPLHADLVLPLLRPALEQSVWLRDNRRIFFLPRWLDAFIGAHRSADALRIVDAYLAANPDLPPDVRRKILEPRDGLEVVVRARADGR